MLSKNTRKLEVNLIDRCNTFFKKKENIVINCLIIRVYIERIMSKAIYKGRVTIAQVAKVAGVSLSTVDRVLNGRAPVRIDTAKHIQAVAESLNFQGAGIIRERVQGKRIRHRLGFLLEQPDSAFYQTLGSYLADATADKPRECESAVVEYMSDLSPEAVSKRLRDLGTRVSAIAVVSADHALINKEIDDLRKKGVPVFALISDLSTPSRAGYAGLDNRRVGRTAAWFITKMAKMPGKIAISVGSHRFQCQELCEMSFRSYMRENAPDFELLEPLVTLESNELAEEGMRELMYRHPDIVGVFVAGGGAEGVIRALKDHSKGFDGIAPVGVARELTRGILDGLHGGYMSAVLSHPLYTLAHRLLDGMILALDNPSSGLQQLVVQMDIQTPDSI